MSAPVALVYEGERFWLICGWHSFCTREKGHEGDHWAYMNPLKISTSHGVYVRSAFGREDRTWGQKEIRSVDIEYEQDT